MKTFQAFLLIIVWILLISFQTFCQCPTFIFSQSNDLDEYPTSVLETVNDDLIISAEQGSFTGNSYDIELLKLNKTGLLQKSITIHKPYFSLAVSKLIMTDNEKIIAIGTIRDTSDMMKIWIFSFDLNLNIYWEKTYNLNSSIISSFSGFIDIFNNLIIYGDGGSWWGNTDIYILKVNLEGDSLASYQYPAPNPQFCFSMIQKPDSTGYYMLIYGNYQIQTNSFGQRLEFDNNFIIQNVDSIPRGLSMYYNLLSIDGYLYISGIKHFSSAIHQTDKLGIIKIESENNVEAEYYAGPDDTVSAPAFLSNLAFSPSLWIYYGGTTGLDQSNFLWSDESSYFILNRLDINLDISWQKFFGGDAYYNLWGIYATSDSGCVLLGSRYSKVNQDFQRDVYIIKVDSTGLIADIPENKALLSKEVILYPNPGSHYCIAVVGIQFSTAEILFYDLYGRLVMEQLLYHPRTWLNTSKLLKGYYIYKIISPDKLIGFGKWIKQ
jgi:hypothetical protein